MKNLFFTYLVGMLASIPAYLMFNQVGASPFRNLDAVSQAQWGSLSSILIYFVLIFIVPTLGAAFGAKIAGCSSGFRSCFRRGIAGQFGFSIGFSLLIMFVAPVGAAVEGLATGFQTIVFLMVAQAGCTLSTVWGF